LQSQPDPAVIAIFGLGSVATQLIDPTKAFVVACPRATGRHVLVSPDIGMGLNLLVVAGRGMVASSRVVYESDLISGTGVS
jgi:hypothetical protein